MGSNPTLSAISSSILVFPSSILIWVQSQCEVSQESLRFRGVSGAGALRHQNSLGAGSKQPTREPISARVCLRGSTPHCESAERGEARHASRSPRITWSQRLQSKAARRPVFGLLLHERRESTFGTSPKKLCSTERWKSNSSTSSRATVNDRFRTLPSRSCGHFCAAASWLTDSSACAAMTASSNGWSPSRASVADSVHRAAVVAWPTPLPIL